MWTAILNIGGVILLFRYGMSYRVRTEDATYYVSSNANGLEGQGLDDRNRMMREYHVRMCERPGVKLSRPTRLRNGRNKVPTNLLKLACLS